MPEFLDSWSDLLRFVAIFQGCYIIGTSVFIIRLYLKSHTVHSNRKTRHIVCLASSHIMLTFLTLRGVHIGVYGPNYLHWPFAVFILILAFALTDYGLREMLTDLRSRRLEKENETEISVDRVVNRTGDPTGGVDRPVAVAEQKTKSKRRGRMK